VRVARTGLLADAARALHLLTVVRAAPSL